MVELMSDTAERLEPFWAWRDAIAQADHEIWAQQAALRNGWFTPSNVKKAIQGILRYFDRLEEFAAIYPSVPTPKKVGVVMAGNIPLVGFQDALLVLLAGHYLVGKLSSQDDYLPREVLALFPQAGRFEFADRLNGCDAFIATGSDNTSRYFEYYFGKYPHIIRKNRTAVAILQGDETDDELALLADDVFDYFGLGCRSVSSIWLPQGFETERLLSALQARAFECAQNHKYANNYDYQKACLLLSHTPHYDNGAVMLVESENLHSPVSSLYYRFYSSENQLKTWLNEMASQIQCVVGRQFLPFGSSQQPDIFFCADEIDTMRFLVDLG